MYRITIGVSVRNGMKCMNAVLCEKRNEKGGDLEDVANIELLRSCTTSTTVLYRVLLMSDTEGRCGRYPMGLVMLRS